MNLYKKILFGLVVSFFMIPATVLAHVKWFIEEGEIISIRSYRFSDKPVLACIIIFVVIVTIGIILEKKLPEKGRIFRSVLDFLNPLVIPLFRILIGLGLITFSLQGYIFAPVYEAVSPFATFISVFQIAIGLALVFGIFREILAILLFFLYALFSLNFGFLGMLETFEFVGIGAVLLLGTPSYFSLFRSQKMEKFYKKYRSYAIPLLRVSVGINLIILGFTEKILHPELGMAFLQEHAFNFMPALGFIEYSDYWFVLSAGFVEVLFGTIFVLGIVTRLNALVISLFFITTLVLLGPSELAGHIPHFAIMFMLLVFGSGEKLKVMNK